MRKEKTVKIDDKEIKVKELRVKDIRSIIEEAENTENQVELIEKMLPKAISLSLSDLEELAPSEIKLLWDAFREVNAVFFDVLDRVEVFKVLKDAIVQDLTGVFADLSSAVMPEPGTTDSPSS